MLLMEINDAFLSLLLFLRLGTVENIDIFGKCKCSNVNQSLILNFVETLFKFILKITSSVRVNISFLSFLFSLEIFLLFLLLVGIGLMLQVKLKTFEVRL